MALFGGKKTEIFSGLLGVDLGTAGIKLVELVPDKGRMRLSTYGYAEPKIPLQGGKGAIEDISKTVAVIKRIMQEGNFKATRAVAALPTTKVFHAIISLPVPRDPKADLRPMIEAQAQKLLPLPIEEMVLDSNVLDKHLLPTEEGAASANEGKYMRVLLTGAPKTLIASYVDLFKAANLELVSLETEIFALTRSLIGKEKSHVLIVDLGAERTNIAIVDQGIPLLTRVIKSGGSNITQALAASLGVSFDEAEAMKRDLSSATGALMPAPLLEALKPIVHEIRYALQLYGEQAGAAGIVEKILLTGGSSRLPGLSEMLSRELNMNVYLGDPWARVASAPDLSGVLDEIGARYAVAVGLAERMEEKT